jgi:hypothetical protein
VDIQQLLDAELHAISKDLAPLAELQASREDELLAKENVVGVGIGHKVKDGEDTGTNCIQVHVRQKMPEELLTKGDVVPKTMDRRPTDVIEIGDVFALGTADATRTLEAGSQELAAGAPHGVEPLVLRERVRPVRPGYSVGHPDVTAGTIGAACYDLTPVPGKPPRYYVLSNNHVIANSNGANLGDPIIQPGRVDGGLGPRDVIGQLSRFVPIRFDGRCNTVDAAVAEVPFHLLDRDIYWIGVPRSLAVAAQVGMLVRKTGRTTNFTTGRVTAINETVNVNFGGGRVARFCRQIVTTDMSAGGDSGSLVVDTEHGGNPVGLLFAGSPTATILNPIASVQIALRVRLWP